MINIFYNLKKMFKIYKKHNLTPLLVIFVSTNINFYFLTYVIIPIFLFNQSYAPLETILFKILH